MAAKKKPSTKRKPPLPPVSRETPVKPVVQLTMQCGKCPKPHVITIDEFHEDTHKHQVCSKHNLRRRVIKSESVTPKA